MRPQKRSYVLAQVISSCHCAIFPFCRHTRVNLHTDRAHDHAVSCAHPCTTHVSCRDGSMEAGRAHRSAREGGRLQLSLQLPTGCEGHRCDSNNYRGRKPQLQTNTAAGKAGFAGLNLPSTSSVRTFIPPGRSSSKSEQSQALVLSTSVNHYNNKIP